MTRRSYLPERVRRNASPMERIAHHVRIDEAGCWVWQSYIMPNGYARLTVDGEVHYAHRFAYEAFVGPIDAGLHIDHLCRVRNCVNPAHLEPVTPKQNINRSPLTSSARTHCPQGHVYDAANTYRACGRRYCRACKRARREVSA